MDNSSKCKTKNNCNPHEARILAQDFGFSVRQCSCGKISLQVGPVTLRLESKALLCLAALLEDAATNLLEQGVSFQDSQPTTPNQSLTEPVFNMPAQDKKWVN